MKLTAAQILHIRTRFQKMQGAAEFVQLLNEVKVFKYGDAAKPFTPAQVMSYTRPDEARKTKRYVQFTIPKKSGKPRTIHAPVKGLKSIQTCLNTILQEVYQPHEAATGFVPGKSILDGARRHLGKPFVYNLDLEDFFPSIPQARVWGRLKVAPFNLAGSAARLQIANIIAGLCCHSLPLKQPQSMVTPLGEIRSQTHRHVLPQGAPTSPTLTNAICERLDRKLTGLAKRFKLAYSRYADDITFSGNTFVFGKNGGFLKELHAIIAGQNFTINEAKTRLQKPGYRQEVTGLTVNEKPNVQPRYLKQLRRWLHLWETYGEAHAQACFLKDYFNPEKGRGRREAPFIGNVLRGKLLYLKMVKGDKNEAYLKLRARLDALMPAGEDVPADRVLLPADKTVIPASSLWPEEPSVMETALSIIASRQEAGLAEAMELLLKNGNNGA